MFKFYRLALLLILATGCAPSAPIVLQTPVPQTEEPIVVTLTPSAFPTLEPSSAPSSTPTLSPELDSLRITFIHDGQLWLWEKGDLQPLTGTEESAPPVISDDGEVIAFRKQGLSLIQYDGSNERVLVSVDDFKSMEPRDPGVFLSQFDWLPGSHTLFFNTVLLSDYGLAYADDLYIADADTMRWKNLRPLKEGGKFLISPDGQHVAMTSPSQISVMKLDGSGYRVLMNYRVPFPSEMSFYAEPSWAADSQSLTVPIPPEDFFYGTTLPTVVWRLPINGASPTVDAELQPGDTGIDQRIWSPKKEHFAFWFEGGYHLDTKGINPNPLTEPGAQRSEFAWVDETHFIYMGTCDLRLGTIGGPDIQISELGGSEDHCSTYYDFAK